MAAYSLVCTNCMCVGEKAVINDGSERNSLQICMKTYIHINFIKVIVLNTTTHTHNTVSRSRCPSYIGIQGIVLQETQNTLKLICKDDKLRGKQTGAIIV